MTLFSPIALSNPINIGNNFSGYQLNRKALIGFIEPVIMFDHYRMYGPTFAPHPHAGFSAISYIFEDSQGALRNRDSLGNDFDIEPGGILWTQAGNGVVHEEGNSNDKEVHGIQLFVNLASQNKSLPPLISYVNPREITQVRNDKNRIRILSGSIDQIESTLSHTEPFDFIEAHLQQSWHFQPKTNQNTLLYVVSGAIKITHGTSEAQLEAYQALGIKGTAQQAMLNIQPLDNAHVLVFSGIDAKESTVIYGPFVMNTYDEAIAASERYQQGLMGRLMPL